VHTACRQRFARHDDHWRWCQSLNTESSELSLSTRPVQSQSASSDAVNPLLHMLGQLTKLLREDQP
jgi:hypothetical protein